MTINHPFKPIYNKESKILILGSFPSVKSREVCFYYGHPQNRFWKIIANIFNENIPTTVDEKKELLIIHDIAIWDTIKSCRINASSDSSIKDAIPNDIETIIRNSSIKAIFCNGNTSYKIFMKYFKDKINLPIFCLPSSSPANAKFSLQDLTNIWSEEIENYIKNKDEN